MSRSAFDAFVPSLGASMRVGQADAQATVVCLCKPDNVPMLIRSTAMAVECVHCRKQYAIQSVQYDRRTFAEPQVVVGVVLMK